MSQPKVTVVLAVKNEARFLKQTVADLLGQTYSNIHIIAIDDGSTDETASLLNLYSTKIQIIRNDVSRGQSHCINRAMELSDSPYLAVADGDDEYVQDKISRQISFLEKHAEIGVCGCQIHTIPTGLHWNLPTTHNKILGRMPFNMPMAHPAIIYRRTALLNSRYDETLRQAKDYDFLYRLRHKTRFYNLPFKGVRYRLNKADSQAQQLRIQTANQIRAAILNEDFGINHPEFIQLHNTICNLQQGADSSLFSDWVNTILSRNSQYHQKSLQQELHTQIWHYINKFKLNRREGLKHLLLSGLPLSQKAKAGIKLLQ